MHFCCIMGLAFASKRQVGSKTRLLWKTPCKLIEDERSLVTAISIGKCVEDELPQLSNSCQPQSTSSRHLPHSALFMNIHGVLRTFLFYKNDHEFPRIAIKQLYYDHSWAFTTILCQSQHFIRASSLSR